jgi:hypothetical protein
MRLQVDPDGDPSSLLRMVKEQYIDALPYEAIGFHEIVANCVEWSPLIDDFWCATHFQNIGPPAETEIAGTRVVLKNYNPRPQNTLTNQVEVQATLSGSDLHLKIDAFSHACSEEIMDRMLDELCAAITELS